MEVKPNNITKLLRQFDVIMSLEGAKFVKKSSSQDETDEARGLEMKAKDGVTEEGEERRRTLLRAD